MNTHSLSSQHNRTNKATRTTGIVMAKVRSTASHPQRRWQSKQRRSSLIRREQASGLSQAEQTALFRQQALLAAQQGNYETAIALFSRLIEQNSDNANDYSNRGLVYFQSGHAEKAIVDFNRAIDLNPRLDSAYNNRANYYAAHGQFLEAILDYDVALDLNPSNVRAWINQGITFRELEMYERAIESFELALYLSKLEGHIYAERGRTYHLRGDWNCAIGDYQRAIVALPKANPFSSDPSARLHAQVEAWMDELISPWQV